MIRVLGIETGNWSTQGILLFFALLEGVHGSLEEVEVCITDRRSAVGPVRAIDALEGEDSVALVDVGDIELVLDPLTTEDKLVFAAHHRDIVVDCKCVVVEVRDGVGAAADGKFIGRRELKTVGLILIEIDA